MRYLEFAGIDHFTGLVSQLEDVYTTVKIRYIHDGLLGYCGNVQYFFTNKIIYLEGIRFVEVLLEVERDLRNGWVGIKLNYTRNGFRGPVSLAFRLKSGQ